jgi:hypothetical protein
MAKCNWRNRLCNWWFFLLSYITLWSSSKEIRAHKYINNRLNIRNEARALFTLGRGKVSNRNSWKLIKRKQWKFNIDRWYPFKTSLSSIWLWRWNYIVWCQQAFWWWDQNVLSGKKRRNVNLWLIYFFHIFKKIWAYFII